MFLDCVREHPHLGIKLGPSSCENTAKNNIARNTDKLMSTDAELDYVSVSGSTCFLNGGSPIQKGFFGI